MAVAEDSDDDIPLFGPDPDDEPLFGPTTPHNPALPSHLRW